MGNTEVRTQAASRSITLAYVALSALAPACSESGAPRDLEDVGSAEIPIASRPPSQDRATFTTLFRAPLVTEGLAVDRRGNLYTAGRNGNNACPVWRVRAGGGEVAIVGSIPPPCNANGLAFDRAGTLYVTNGADKIYALTPSDVSPPTATLFASGVSGANGLAFDERGNLWATDGGTGQGRVWSIAPDGTVTEKFRIQPLANVVNLAAVVDSTGAATTVGGIGRDARALPPGKLTVAATTRSTADTAGSVAIVANGIAFTSCGAVVVTDTARGAIWKVKLDGRGDVRSELGCDTTFEPNTLCLENLLVQHPALEGLDGIALDGRDTIWGAANERNALVAVSEAGVVTQVFRNVPATDTRLRNTGPLEFPTSLAFVGRKLCLAQTDVSRRDNFPNTAGEVAPGSDAVAKIACLDQLLPHPGL
jgi:sugar lactone lactonase YvrE